VRIRQSIPLVTTLLALTAVGGAPAPSAGVVELGTCEVDNVTQGQTYGPDRGAALEDAVTDAVSGDLLEVTGQCNGEYDMGLAGPLTFAAVAVRTASS